MDGEPVEAIDAAARKGRRVRRYRACGNHQHAVGVDAPTIDRGVPRNHHLVEAELAVLAKPHPTTVPGGLPSSNR